jgi:hypothetical protein
MGPPNKKRGGATSTLPWPLMCATLAIISAAGYAMYQDSVQASKYEPRMANRVKKAKVVSTTPPLAEAPATAAPPRWLINVPLPDGEYADMVRCHRPERPTADTVPLSVAVSEAGPNAPVGIRD